MTPPIEEIQVVCPACGATYADWRLSSPDPSLDPADHEAASTATCPSCGHSVAIATLVARWNDEDEEVYVQESVAEG